MEANLYDMRSLTPEQLAAVIAALRQERGWTQATLAELAGLTERTVQRVEGGEPSSLDTRRALARSFGWEDIDVFSKPWPFPNAERLQAERDRLDRETVPVSIIKFSRGRQLREIIEGAQAFGFLALTELPTGAEPIWAGIEDYLKDYDVVDDCYSAIEKLKVDDDLQNMLDDFGSFGLAVGGGTRRVSVRFPLASTEGAPLRLIVSYVVACPEKAFPTSIRVPRSGPIGP